MSQCDNPAGTVLCSFVAQLSQNSVRTCKLLTAWSIFTFAGQCSSVEEITIVLSQWRRQEARQLVWVRFGNENRTSLGPPKSVEILASDTAILKPESTMSRYLFNYMCLCVVCPEQDRQHAWSCCSDWCRCFCSFCFSSALQNIREGGPPGGHTYRKTVSEEKLSAA